MLPARPHPKTIVKTDCRAIQKLNPACVNLLEHGTPGACHAQCGDDFTPFLANALENKSLIRQRLLREKIHHRTTAFFAHGLIAISNKIQS